MNPAFGAGGRLGPYELGASLGAGGMGEVYRAHDTRLGRDVAIKILPSNVAENADRLRRFAREARAAAALNHPNILSVHDVGEWNGVTYLVTELLEGQTLRSALAGGRVPVARAVAIGTAIADGLAAAHAQGIIHRDLKPENLFLTRDGRAKILDFGLAKLAPGASVGGTGEGGIGENNSDALTRLSSHTTAGVLLGTAGYMAPEQIRGQPVDHRADIFALGCVLYEMLAGRRAFIGNTFDTLASILRDEPPSLSAIEPHRIPQELIVIVERCLEKKTEDRFQAATDLAFGLKNLSSVHQPPRRRPVASAAISVAILASLGAFGAWRSWTDVSGSIAGVPPAAVQFTIPRPAGTTFDPEGGVAISPDGRHVVFVTLLDGKTEERGQRQLYLHDLKELQARPIGDPTISLLQFPFFSPDGRWVAFFSGRALMKMSLENGASERICTLPDFPQGAIWRPDDRIVFSVGKPYLAMLTEVAHLWSVPAAGGTPERLLSGTPASWPSFQRTTGGLIWTGLAPHADHVAEAEIGGSPSPGKEPRHVWTGAVRAQYAPSGYLAIARSGRLWALPFSAERFVATGALRPLVDSLWTSKASMFAAFSVSESGRLAYFSGGEEPERQLVKISRSGVAQPLNISDARAYYDVRLSPDGTYMAFTAGWGSHPLYVRELSSGRTTAFGSGDVHGFAWTSDSSRLVYSSGGAIYSKRVDGTGVTDSLLNGLTAEVSSLSNRGVVYSHRSGSARPINIFMTPLGRGTPRILIGTPAHETHGTVSPDNRSLAYQSNSSGQAEIWVRRFPEADRAVVVSVGVGQEPVWSADGRSLFYRNGARVFEVEFDPVVGIPRSAPKLLFEHRQLSTAGVRNYDVASDGSFIGIVETERKVPIELRVVIDAFARRTP